MAAAFSHIQTTKSRVGLLNLMPNKEETEQHWIELLGDSYPLIELCLITTASYQSKRTPADYFASKQYSYGLPERLDALIVTGAPFGTKEYSDILYWPEFQMITTQAHQQALPVFYSCWSANAALAVLYQAERREFKQKLSGVYTHKVQEHFITQGLEPSIRFPHSRYSQSCPLTLQKAQNLTVLIDSEHAGATFLIDQYNAYLLAHPEYESDTLYREYQRDVARGLNPQLPEFDSYFQDPKQKKAKPSWREHGSALLQNWLLFHGIL